MINPGIHSARFARPYARAAFDYAREHQQLDQWATMLLGLSQRVQLPLVAELLKNPSYSTQIREEVILALGQGILDKAGENFIKMLASQQRLMVLPDIYLLFEQLRIAIEKTLRVQVKSAVALSEDHCEKITAYLSVQLGRSIELECELDSTLLGGFVVYAGDRVIDSSLRGQLEKLRNAVVG